MLREVLHAIENTDGPLTVTELSRRLGVERSALDGMITYWVQKGRLRTSDAPIAADMPACHCAVNSQQDATCTPERCVYIAKMPRTYTPSQL